VSRDRVLDDRHKMILQEGPLNLRQVHNLKVYGGVGPPGMRFHIVVAALNRTHQEYAEKRLLLRREPFGESFESGGKLPDVLFVNIWYCHFQAPFEWGTLLG
jgi:hypothetical protein